MSIESSGVFSTLRRRLARQRWLVPGLALAGIATAVFLLWPRGEDAPAEVRRDQLETRDGRLYLPGESRPYSGLLVADWPGTKQRKSALPLEDGRVHGAVRGWHDSGQLETEEIFKDGVSDGPRTRWHKNGAKRSETEIVKGKLEGRHTEWHPNGVKALEMTLTNGKVEGLAQAWYPSGRIKSRTRLAGGEAKERQFFKDDAASTPMEPGETAAANDGTNVHE